MTQSFADNPQVKDTPAELVVEIANRQWFAGTFLLLWAIGGLVWCIGASLQGTRGSSDTMALALMVCCWAALAITVGATALWLMLGQQRLQLDAAALELQSSLWRFHRVKRIPSANVSALRLVKVRGKGGIVTGRIIKIEVGKKAHRFGHGLTIDQLR